MNYSIYSQSLGKWLKELLIPESARSPKPQWTDEIWRRQKFESRMAIAILQMLGNDLVLVPEQGETPEWFDKGTPIKTPELTRERHKLIESMIYAQWDISGNPCWFVDFGNLRTIGPISMHPLGGFTRAYHGDRSAKNRFIAIAMCPELLTLPLEH